MKRKNSAESDEEADYTEEQVKAVQRVENAKDYYSALGLGKEFTTTDLKKQYRRLALVLHPDKNHAPGAAEAFKKISKAFATLNDAEKRAKYDKYGEDEVAAKVQEDPDEGELWAHFERAFGSTVTPEDAFNLFFGRHHAKMKDPFQPSEAATFFYRAPGDSTMWIDIQRLVPLALVLLLSILCSVLGDWFTQTTWSATSDSTYSIPRRTVSTDYDLQYFVATSFESDYPTVKDIKRLEKEVEKTIVGNLRSTCTQETSARDRRVAAAKRAYFTDPYEIYNLKNQRLKSCEELAALKKNLNPRDPVIADPAETINVPKEERAEDKHTAPDPADEKDLGTDERKGETDEGFAAEEDEREVREEAEEKEEEDEREVREEEEEEDEAPF